MWYVNLKYSFFLIGLYWMENLYIGVSADRLEKAIGDFHAVYYLGYVIFALLAQYFIIKIKGMTLTLRSFGCDCMLTGFLNMITLHRLFSSRYVSSLLVCIIGAGLWAMGGKKDYVVFPVLYVTSSSWLMYQDITSMQDTELLLSMISTILGGLLFIYMYSQVDLLARHIDTNKFLDHYSVNGFMRSRPYATEGAAEIARRSRGTPRIANRLLRRVRDFAEVKGNGHIDADIADRALDMLNVDQKGFDHLDRRLLLAMIEKFDGGPVGVDSLAASLSEERGTIEDVLEPYLIQQGYMVRTPRGRMVTRNAYLHFGLPAPQSPREEGGSLPLDLSIEPGEGD